MKKISILVAALIVLGAVPLLGAGLGEGDGHDRPCGKIKAALKRLARESGLRPDPGAREGRKERKDRGDRADKEARRHKDEKAGHGRGAGRGHGLGHERLKFDKDGDGKLSREEKAACKEARGEQWRKIREEILRRFDKDADGKISEAEMEAGRKECRGHHKKDGHGKRGPEAPGGKEGGTIFP